MKKALLIAAIASICLLIIGVIAIHFDINKSTVISLVHRDPPSEFCYYYVSEGYPQTIFFNNGTVIQEFHNTIKDKVAKRENLGMPVKDKTILTIDYGQKGNTISVDTEGRVFISVYVSDIRNKSTLHWLWWKLDTSSKGHLVYRTEADSQVLKIAENIKTYIDDDIRKKAGILNTGVYEMQESNEPLKPSVILKENGEFVFNYSALSSYLPIGTYYVKEGELILKTSDNKNTYIFKVKDNSLIFQKARSSSIVIGNVNDAAVFKYKRK